MSPLDMLIFLFFILVTIKAASASIEYWRDADDESSCAPKAQKPVTTASLSRTVRTGRPASVRVTPIKRVNTPVTASGASCSNRPARQYHLKDKGAA